MAFVCIVWHTTPLEDYFNPLYCSYYGAYQWSGALWPSDQRRWQKRRMNRNLSIPDLNVQLMAEQTQWERGRILKVSVFTKRDVVHRHKANSTLPQKWQKYDNDSSVACSLYVQHRVSTVQHCIVQLECDKQRFVLQQAWFSPENKPVRWPSSIFSLCFLSLAVFVTSSVFLVLSRRRCCQSHSQRFSDMAVKGEEGGTMLRHVTYQRWGSCSTRKASSQCDVTHFVMRSHDCLVLRLGLRVRFRSRF